MATEQQNGAPPATAGLDERVTAIARAALVVLRAHPGCGAIAGLVHAVARFPGQESVEIAAEKCVEDAKDEAYREVWRLNRVVRDLQARIAQLEQEAFDVVSTAGDFTDEQKAGA